MTTWKENELRVARFFGAERSPGSGSDGKMTRSDSTHPRLYIEQKRRKKHAVVTLFDQVAARAKHEGKIPVVTLSEHGRPGFWVVCRSEDLLAIADERRRGSEDIKAIADAVRRLHGE